MMADILKHLESVRFALIKTNEETLLEVKKNCHMVGEELLKSKTTQR